MNQRSPLDILIKEMNTGGVSVELKQQAPDGSYIPASNSHVRLVNLNLRLLITHI